ncbi:ParB/RepB/Spo0J family partition protein [Kitasatospora sp. NPDC008115]|uniref:ParB/RepB/Spo0J family partition protein n=1 Tax=Kitasatospora sp. NPDC008115 TaxID=3364022 RepID=UPI0036E36456
MSQTTPGLQNNLSLAERRRLRQQQQQAQPGAGPKVTALLSELAPNPANPRGTLPRLEELADSIRRGGIAQSLTIIPSSVYAAAYPEHVDRVAAVPFVVINGNRRLAAAEMASLPEVPVLINTTATTRTEILVLALTENIQREDLSALEELETIEELKELLGTYAAVAAALGKSEGWVSQRRRLANLAPDVLDAFKAGGMTIEQARDLGKIKDHAAQREAWTRSQEKGVDKPTEKAAPRKASKARLPRQAAAKPDSDPAVGARRAACQAALTGTPADDTAVVLSALRSPASDDGTAEWLAGQWLAAVNGDAEPGSSFASTATANPRQAVLAIALAQCELRITGTPARVDRPYIGWLVEHAAYEATAAELRLLDDDPAFTA